MTESLRALFEGALDSAQIMTEEHDLSFWGRDLCKSIAARPGLILFPTSYEQVSSIVRICAANGVRIVPSGGRTGYSAGATATAGEVVVSLTRMNKVLEVNSFDATVRCQAGVTTEALQNAAREHGLYYPVDFTSRGSSTIGGNIATNAGGIRVIRYGNTRDWVLGLKVVLSDGSLIELNGPLYKNNTGYDLRALFSASEGTLGIIVEATMRLTQPPKEGIRTLCAVAGAPEALAILRDTRRGRFTISVFEYFEHNGLELVLKHHPDLSKPFSAPHPAYLLTEIETGGADEAERWTEFLGELAEAGRIADAVIAGNAKQEQELFAYRELIGYTANQYYVPHKNDISVPISVIPGFIEELRGALAASYPSNQVVVFGHLGDGNLHVNILRADGQDQEQFAGLCRSSDKKLFEIVERYRGSISAEHGVGLLKKPYLHYSRSERELDVMRAVKKALDPAGIFNPGKIFD